MKNKIISLFLLLTLVALFLLYQGIYLPLNEKTSIQETIFEIQKNEGLFTIAENLEEKKLIKHNLLFELYVVARYDFYNLKKGHYRLNSSMSIAEIAHKIIEGDTIQVKLTFIEGWNIDQIANYLEQENVLKKERFIKSTQTYQNNLEVLKSKPKDTGLEGYLFPDTYSFNKNVNSKEIIDRMVLSLQRKLKQEIGKDLNLKNKTIHEIITMASLIEKEVQTYEDKRLVSGIAWKRMQNQIPLQMDATITYLTGKKSSKVSIKETNIDSPYNTYKYKGLPPGPISNPSLDSIKAALDPKESDYWYYLSAPNGKTIFSKNFIQHKRAKQEYLR